MAPKPLTLRLVAESRQVTPGQSFLVGLFLQHAPYHHSYYKFSGIVGVPTSIGWDLPEDLEAGQLQWPTPERVDMRGRGAYGYHEDTLLLTRITVPESMEGGEKITLKGRVGYMCCSQERCTPGFDDVALTLAMGEKAVPDPVWKTRIAETLETVPRPLEGWEAEVSITTSGKAFRLVLRPPSGLEEASLPDPGKLYFFSWNGWTASNEPHQCQWGDDASTYVFVMPKHPYPDEAAVRFQGTVRSETGWPDAPEPMKGLWLDLPLPAGVRETP